MKKAIATTYSLSFEHRERRVYLSKIVIGCCLIMALFYAFSMYKIVSRTVAAQKIEEQTASLANSLQNLDTQYIALTNKITPDLGKKYGLNETSVSAFIPRSVSLGSLHYSLNEL